MSGPGPILPGQYKRTKLSPVLKRFTSLVEQIDSAYDALERLLRSEDGKLFLQSDVGMALMRERSRLEQILGVPDLPAMTDEMPVSEAHPDRVTQMAIAEQHALSQGGHLDLRAITDVIRELGLSKAKDDRGLIKNLRSRLLESGKWTRTGQYTLFLKSFSQGDTPDGEAVAYSFAGSSQDMESQDALLVGPVLDEC